MAFHSFQHFLLAVREYTYITHALATIRYSIYSYSALLRYASSYRYIDVRARAPTHRDRIARGVLVSGYVNACLINCRILVCIQFLVRLAFRPSARGRRGSERAGASHNDSEL
jgi:hypothetical protein